ncbi:putative CDC12-septin [Basidiobolus meristosporus CBS 931.73]|uniref:Putative CDC12-septin n=1 Tax=Basidiobolus meristosporus CBS 931.73 TaxID=1314790 RepID=A0A1Y1Z1J2_9FUNG|nr:putative CDC12-septin [Basidiobolus meristosporus CBS 931.73]|eukprot:ORY03964.1 putative CDC12-septin [Basidiobolus meristosporus CBS 931.73]
MSTSASETSYIRTQGVGIAHLPNQRHKIVTRQGSKFTLMVVGESGLGKTTFVNTLFTTTIKDYKSQAQRHAHQADKTVDITVTKAELEEKMFNMKLNVIDTPGFGDFIDNSESWVPIVDFIDGQYESYMKQEQQPIRNGIIDVRVHVCLYFIRPTGHSLKPLDIEIMKQLGTRVNLIPVIAKADTLSPFALQQFKARIRETIAAQEIHVYTCPIESDDEATMSRNREMMEAMPFAIIASDQDVTTKDGRRVKGREYPWGVVEVENDSHCDFRKLRDLLIRTHMYDLINTTEEVHYTKYRSSLMNNNEPKPRPENKKHKEEEEALHRRFAEKVKIEEARFRQWEQRLIAERVRLNEDLEANHNLVKQLEAEVEALSSSQTSKTYRRF